VTAPRTGRVWRSLGRYLLLALATGLLHLALLWLWDPLVPVPPPMVVRLCQPGGRECPPAAAPDEVVVVVGGDTAPTDAALTTLHTRGYEYPYAATVGLLRSSDLTLVNLEAPVTERNEPFALYKRYVYRVEPAALEALAWAGVGAVTLANNHIMDYGVGGVEDTLEQLRRAGIVPVGAGTSAAQARRGVVFEVRGVRLGVLSFLEDSLMHSIYVRSFAGAWRPGCARMSLASAKEDIARLRRRADLVLVVAHWGASYGEVTWRQRYLGKALIDYGADVVVGHHPHVHQPVAVHRGKPIVYSLGNYAFGTPGQDWFRHGLLARLRIRGTSLRRLELIPLLVQNRMVHFKPEPERGGAAASMLRALARSSARHGARLRVVGDMAVWEPGR